MRAGVCGTSPTLCRPSSGAVLGRATDAPAFYRVKLLPCTHHKCHAALLTRPLACAARNLQGEGSNMWHMYSASSAGSAQG